MLSVRPKIAELTVQLFGRSIHPELFQVYASKCYQRSRYDATVQVTSAGHVVVWRHQGLVLTEVAAAANHPLPQRRRLMAHRALGERADRVELRGGGSYEVKFAMEPVEVGLFNFYQNELSRCGKADGGIAEGVFHQFDKSERFGLGALSYMHVESRDRTFKVQTLHTFPDDCALLKCETVFRLPK